MRQDRDLPRRAGLSVLSLSLFVLVAGAPAWAQEAPAEQAPGVPRPEVVQYASHGLSLQGFLYKPQGAGPFPAYLWNHGSEKDAGPSNRVAKFWTERGFVYFKPIRSGHGGNPGPYIVDQQKAIANGGGSWPAKFRQVVALHERANDDVVAAYRWLRAQPFVDPKRIVVAGGSFGGIQTLLTAERDAREGLGVKCFVAMSPAAMSWNPLWAERLTRAVQSARAPIFLLQAQNDFNLGPSEVLGPRIDAKGAPNRHRIFPIHLLPGGDPNDHQQGHGAFFMDPDAWEKEVLAYLHDCGER
jgi:carboxymethylenebutenolidase